MQTESDFKECTGFMRNAINGQQHWVLMTTSEHSPDLDLLCEAAAYGAGSEHVRKFNVDYANAKTGVLMKIHVATITKGAIPAGILQLLLKTLGAVAEVTDTSDLIVLTENYIDIMHFATSISEGRYWQGDRGLN